MGTTINKYADTMLARISQCVAEETKKMPALSGAVVSSVNTDGTVNVYFPPDDNKIFTNISNQTPFTLQAGDSVELLLKDGSYNNCWVIAKHQDTNKASLDYDYSKEVDLLDTMGNNFIPYSRRANLTQTEQGIARDNIGAKKGVYSYTSFTTQGWYRIATYMNTGNGRYFGESMLAEIQISSVYANTPPVNVSLQIFGTWQGSCKIIPIAAQGTTATPPITQIRVGYITDRAVIDIYYNPTSTNNIYINSSVHSPVGHWYAHTPYLVTDSPTVMGSLDLSKPTFTMCSQLLWTNSAPTTEYAAQTLSLSLSQFRYVMIEYTVVSSTAGTRTTQIVPYGSTSIALGTINSQFYSRSAAFTATTGITFGAGSLFTDFGTASTSNTSMIPYRIYGIS